MSEENVQEKTQLEKDREWRKNVYRGDEPQLTVRAIVTGLLLGWVMALANLYVGLKSGWGIGVEVTAVVLAFAIWKGIEGLRRDGQSPVGRTNRRLPGHPPWPGDRGPLPGRRDGREVP